MNLMSACVRNMGDLCPAGSASEKRRSIGRIAYEKMESNYKEVCMRTLVLVLIMWMGLTTTEQVCCYSPPAPRPCVPGGYC